MTREERPYRRPGWPIVVIAPLSGAVVAMAIFFWTKIRRTRGHMALVLPYILSLIQALHENLEALQLEVEAENRLDFFVTELNENLAAIEEKLTEVTESLSGLNGLERVTKELDEKLVKTLWVEPGVASILESYLPRPGQTWIGFIQSLPRTEDQQQFYETVSREKALQMELKETVLDSIKELRDILKDSSADVNRGDDSDAEGTSLKTKIIKVFFATDREVTANGEYVGRMSRKLVSLQQQQQQHRLVQPVTLRMGQPRPIRNTIRLHFGWVEVGLPGDAHAKGSLEAPANDGEEVDPVKHVVIFSRVDTNLRDNLGEFLACVNEDLRNRHNGGELLVYVHGYNVKHLDAVKQAAQLSYDLKFQGTIILYSWSSKGSLDGYLTDQKTVKKTVPSLHQFLRSIMDMVNAPAAHILAHSMGNRALIGALQVLHEEPGACVRNTISCPLSQIIFVAADEERRLFEELLRTIHKYQLSNIPTADPSATGLSTFSSTDTGRSMTNSASGSTSVDKQPHLSVYCSTKDRALTVSRHLRGGTHRLGDTNSLFTSAAALDAIHDVIDVTGTSERGTSAYKLHHSYHLKSPEVIEDIGDLLAEKNPASARTARLHRIPDFKGRSFYAFRTEPWTRS